MDLSSPGWQGLPPTYALFTAAGGRSSDAADAAAAAAGVNEVSALRDLLLHTYHLPDSALV